MNSANPADAVAMNFGSIIDIGDISEIPSITQVGSGIWCLDGGTLVRGHDSAPGAGQLRLTGGALAANGTRTIANAVTFSAATTISGSSALTFTGAWTLTGTHAPTVAVT